MLQPTIESGAYQAWREFDYLAKKKPYRIWKDFYSLLRALLREKKGRVAPLGQRGR